MSRREKTNSRDHLFVSYAWEDGALAEWLTLKLTAEGYLVWCDRFKILGGENWPDDVDEAIRNRTFRMLHLVSRHSLRKPNPKKERELALQLERARGDEILIPLNVDGTKPSALPWRIVDVAYIAFMNWRVGFAQLLKKLDSVQAPRPRINSGRKIAGSAFLVGPVVKECKEALVSNVFPFTSIPKVVRHFSFSREIQRSEAAVTHADWAFKNLGGRRALSFTPPPKSVTDLVPVEESGRTEWQTGATIDGILAEHLVSELLSKSLEVHCRVKGLMRDPGGRGFYFPFGLLQRNTLFFEGYRGKRTRTLACGYRTFGARKYRYHLCPWFRVRRDFDSSVVAQLRLRLYFADYRGAPLDARASLVRRKKIGAGWWNGQWLNRQIAVISFLAGGLDEITIGDELENKVVLAGFPISGLVDRAIDEEYLSTVGAPLGMVAAIGPESQEAEGDA